MKTFEVTFRIKQEDPDDADRQIKAVVDAENKFDALGTAADQLFSSHPDILQSQVFPQQVDRLFSVDTGMDIHFFRLPAMYLR